MCQTTILFGKLKDRSLEINILALNNCFTLKNVFQNGVSALSKRVLKILHGFMSESSKFGVVFTI